MTYVVTKPFRHEGKVIAVGTELPDNFARNMRALEKVRMIRRADMVTIVYQQAPVMVNAVPPIADSVDDEETYKEDFTDGTGQSAGEGSTPEPGNRKYQSRGTRRG